MIFKYGILSECHISEMFSEDLKGGKFILTCYQVTSVLSGFSCRKDMLLHGQVTKDEIP